jgi:hypothetical protein
MTLLTRRQFLPLIFAPAIIRVADLMPIKQLRDDYTYSVYLKPAGAEKVGFGSLPPLNLKFLPPGLFIGNFPNSPARVSAMITAEANRWYKLVVEIKNATETEAMKAAAAPAMNCGEHWEYAPQLEKCNDHS